MMEGKQLRRCLWVLWCGAVMLLVFASAGCSAQEEDYTFGEEFLVRPLKDGRVLTHWQFVTRWHPEAGQIAGADRTPSFPFCDLHAVILQIESALISRIVSVERAKHFGLFPKTLGQIVQRFSVQELHLSLTQVRRQCTRLAALARSA
jgi:hypothetical protein